MKTQNNRVTEKRIFEAMHKLNDLNKGSNVNSATTENKNMHHIELPDIKTSEVVFEYSIVSVGQNEFSDNASNHLNRRLNPSQGNTFETKPFSEIYNMAVMRDSY